ncbi:3-isopropylmalate dehydratase small subunit [Alkalibacillus aidingensis]|uniref:3-isopropylmalate dehydratase small subunit n=1 Tax=Alkalibacillus aidingensis TaxID=2747607 RepID=UPI0016610A7B|nr:3-isopropylmalate dehydratase small subunit [Alkalibacillus aidingensis]
MQPFRKLDGKVTPIYQDDIDTDIIVPTEFIKRIERTGFDQYLMYYWRYDEHGKEYRDFPLNQKEYKGAPILLTGANFGCGSSRENAVWALYDFGFRAILAPSFADIFKNNCQNNGLLPIELEQGVIDELYQRTQEESLFLTIDLENNIISDRNQITLPIHIDPKTRHKFLEGLDDIDLTLSVEKEITDFENRRPFYMDPIKK